VKNFERIQSKQFYEQNGHQLGRKNKIIINNLRINHINISISCHIGLLGFSKVH
jgi:hypothetical protein